MSIHLAVRVGEKIPDGYSQMEQLKCKECGATFWIAHQNPFKDTNRTKNQIETLKTTLSGEHVDENFKDHNPTYIVLRISVVHVWVRSMIVRRSILYIHTLNL